MTSDSPNKDRDMNERAPDPRPSPSRRVAWEYKGDADDYAQSLPQWYLMQVDLVWSGIVLAAACYPIVLAGFVTIYSVFAFGFGGRPSEMVGLLFVVLLISFVVGAIYGILMSIPAWFSTELFRWVLKGIISDRGLYGIYGGMTGFLCVSGGGLFFVGGMPPFRRWEEALPFVLMSLLAVVMGHWGAIWTGYRKRYEGFPFFEPIFSFEKQITISYLMKLTFIVAVLAVIFKAAGPTGLNVGIAWLVYLTAQTLLLVCDQWIARWLNKR